MLRLVALFVLVGLVPVGLLAWASIELATRAVHDQVEDQLHGTAVVSATYVAEDVEGIVKLVESFAQRPGVREAIAGDEHALADHPLSEHLGELRAADAGLAGAFISDTYVAPEAVTPRDQSR